MYDEILRNAIGSLFKFSTVTMRSAEMLPLMTHPFYRNSKLHWVLRKASEQEI